MMSVMSKAVFGAILGTCLVVYQSGTGLAQALSPMRGEVTSYTDSFAVRVFPANPYDHRIRIEVKVYDQDFNPVDARIAPANFTLGGKLARPVNVLIPFDGAKQRKIRICAESVPFPGKTSTIRAQVCGKFLGTRAN